jgi:alkylation response protein AidB-like acyl-CoA dehydrogenase
MQNYTAPLRDMRFVLHELHDSSSLNHLPGLEEITPDLLDTILDEAAKFMTAVLLPLNASGDAQGCRLDDGVVHTPKGFKDAYRQFAEGGWTALNCDPDYGGQGLPESVSKLIEEIICGCNLSFGLYPGLSHGAYMALRSHGSDALKDQYLPKLVDGSWTGTMCLTEPHCGTDLGLLRTKAVPQADGSYKITGTKIFISAGEHDLTENIVHLVLARLPDAPAGIKGISCSWCRSSCRRPTARSGRATASVRASSTRWASRPRPPVMNFDGATGWLVGEPNKGMRAMFVMMNSERLASRCRDSASARRPTRTPSLMPSERLQGRSLAGRSARQAGRSDHRASRRAPRC